MQIFLIMALTRQKKEEIVEDIRKKVTDQTVIYFVNYKGLKARNLEELRNKLKEVEADIMVVKKTLAKIALEEEGIDLNPEELEGEIAFVFGFGDIVSPAKVVDQFSKDFNLKILGALLDESVLATEKVEQLAGLPNKEQLRAQLVSTIAAPLSGFVGVLEGNIKGLLTVLKKQSEKEEK